MAKLLGDDAYRAARRQTTEKMNLVLDAFIAIAKETATVQNTQPAFTPEEETSKARPDSGECAK